METALIKELRVDYVLPKRKDELRKPMPLPEKPDVHMSVSRLTQSPSPVLIVQAPTCVRLRPRPLTEGIEGLWDPYGYRVYEGII